MSDQPKDSGPKMVDSHPTKPTPSTPASEPKPVTKPAESAASAPAQPKAVEQPVTAPAQPKTGESPASTPAALPTTEKKPAAPAEPKVAERLVTGTPAQAKIAEKPAAKPEEAQAAEKPVAADPPKTVPGSNVALVVDDEPANRDFLMRLLEQTGLEVKGASDGKEALDIIQRYETMALLAIDHKLPDMDGVDLIQQLRERFPAACVVMATMLDERALVAQAFQNGCNVFLVKPHGFMELFRRLQETGPDPKQLDRLIIDQYGLRPYRG